MHWVEHLQEPRDQDSEAGVDVEFNASLFEAVRSLDRFPASLEEVGW